MPVLVSSVSRRARRRRFWASLNFPFKGARIVCLLVGFPSTIKRFVLQVGFPSTFKTVCSGGRFPVGCQNCSFIDKNEIGVLQPSWQREKSSICFKCPFLQRKRSFSVVRLARITSIWERAPGSAVGSLERGAIQ